MRKNNLQCRIKLKQKWKTRGERLIVPGLLKRDFMTNEPNKKWVTDITYIQYDNTTKHLSTIINLFNTEIVTCKLYVHQQPPPSHRYVTDSFRKLVPSRRNHHPFRSRGFLYFLCFSRFHQATSSLEQHVSKR